MGIKETIKSYFSTAYHHTVKNVNVKDIVDFYRNISDISNTCKMAKGNHTCLNDCIHCEILNNKIKEIIKK